MTSPLTLLLLGFGATATMDLAAFLLHRIAGLPFPDYALVGRWVAHLRLGRWRHASIARSAAMPCERVIGWTFHYATGVAFAGVLVAMAGTAWLREPTLLPALAVGIATVAAPFLVLQPGMGMGVAARLAPQPGRARLRSLLNHALFGLGLYVAGEWLAMVR